MRTTVVGTYPRIGDRHEEQSLRRAIARFDKGEATADDVRNAERDVVKTVLAEQDAAGIDVVTDGQVAWNDSQSHVARGLDGIELGGLVRYFDTNTYYRQPIVHRAVAWKAPILVDEWKFAQASTRLPVKAVLTGPATLAALALDRHYGRKGPLVRDLAKALAQETAALRSAGVQRIQIDEPILTRHPEDLSLASDALEVLAAEKGDAELTLATYFGDVSKIYPSLLTLPADVLGLDLVQGAKTWAQIRRRPFEKALSLGLIDARNTRLEEPKAIAAKVKELRDALDLGRSYLSPSNGLEFLPRETARRKLAVVAEAARLVGGAA